MKKAGVDQKLLAILDYNHIDINKVEKFIGVNENYYEVTIDGKIEKLKIPGKIYTEIEEKIFGEDEIFTSFEEEIKNDEIEKLLNENILKIEPKMFEEELLEDKKEKESISIDTFEEELEKNEIENKEFLKTSVTSEEVKKEINKPKKTKITTKKIDKDIDDFINII